MNKVKNLLILECSNNLLTTLDVSGFTRIETMYCSHNQLSNLDISGLATLDFLDSSFNQLKGSNAFTFSGTNKLRYLNCSNNQLESFILTNSIIVYLDLTHNQTLTIVDLSGCSFLKGAPLENSNGLDLSNSQLNTIILNNCPKLNIVKCNDNQLTNMQSLIELDCSNNKLAILNVDGMLLDVCGGGFSCGGIEKLNCSNNLLTSLTILGDINYYNGLILNCNQNQFKTLDFSTNKRIKILDFGNNLNLSSINLKNSTNENVLWFENTPLLQNICQDNNQVTEIQNAVAYYGYTNCSVSSDCSLSNINYDLIPELKIYPNPVKTLLNLGIPLDIKITSISVSNALGQLVLLIPDVKKVRTVDVSNLVVGTYFMKINSAEGTVTRKFVKD